MMTTKKEFNEKDKRRSFSLREKYLIIKDVEDKVPYENIMAKYNLKDKANISRIIKDK
jgi:hypothetical protein